MRPIHFALAVAFGGSLFISAIAFAHHGYAAYDPDTINSLKGTVTSYVVQNPHSSITFDVKGKNGKIQHWSAEFGSAQTLHAAGWTNQTIKAGDVVTIYCHPAKNGSYTVDLLRIVLPDGQTLFPFPTRPPSENHEQGR